MIVVFRTRIIGRIVVGVFCGSRSSGALVTVPMGRIFDRNIQDFMGNREFCAKNTIKKCSLFYREALIYAHKCIMFGNDFRKMTKFTRHFADFFALRVN